MTLSLNPAGSAESLRVQKKEPRYNVKITMYNFLILEFYLLGSSLTLETFEGLSLTLQIRPTRCPETFVTANLCYVTLYFAAEA